MWVNKVGMKFSSTSCLSLLSLTLLKLRTMTVQRDKPTRNKHFFFFLQHLLCGTDKVNRMPFFLAVVVILTSFSFPLHWIIVISLAVADCFFSASLFRQRFRFLHSCFYHQEVFPEFFVVFNGEYCLASLKLEWREFDNKFHFTLTIKKN